MGTGEQLLQLCARAETELLLVAPFVKTAVVERILAVTRPDVEVCCYTRWRPDEIAAGICDTEFWPILAQRGRSALRLAPHLHAKYYRADDDCLVGSANLTAAAMGWSSQSNLELMTALSSEGFRGFEDLLHAESVPVSEELYLSVVEAAQAIPRPAQPPPPTSDPPGGPYSQWLPESRHPEGLFGLYHGDEFAASRAAIISAQRDLAILAIPPGLDREQFRKCVGVLLLQHPVVRKVDDASVVPLRFGAVTDLIRRGALALEGQDPAAVWQTLMRWLLYFLPDRYQAETPRHSEIFRRR